MFQLVVSLSLVSSVFSAVCSYQGDGVSAKWQVANGELAIEFTNSNIGNNQWTGIGFGDGMSNLEVVLFPVENNKARLVTGYTKGYGPPTIDSSANVTPVKITYNSNSLTVLFNRPLGSNGDRKHSLSQCSTWNFVAQGEMEDGDFSYHLGAPENIEVCPRQCRKKLF